VRHLGIISLLLFGTLSLGICGVFSLFVLERLEHNLAETETAALELLQGQRDKLDIARNIRLGSGVLGAGLLLAGVGLVIRRRWASRG